MFKVKSGIKVDSVDVINSAGYWIGSTITNDKTTASSSNGASTIVLRNAAGAFSAGAITGTSFTGDGSALTTLNASNVSSGTLDNARTTASSSNGASTIVARDASGSFSANQITGTLVTAAQPNITSVGTLTGLNVAGNILPTSNVTYDLGSTTQRFKDLYLSGSTVYIGDATLSVAGADLTVSGNVNATYFVGNGATLTNLNASNVSSGTLANARTTASASNGASTIVARDAAGAFSAGAITGTSFTGDGSALTSLNGSQVTSGTVANARTTASASNGASTIVSRDASGAFAAGAVTVTDLTVGGNAVITGNLTVNGTTTTVNSNEVSIGDSILVLNSDETSTPSQDAGIEIERGTSTNVKVLWNESSDRWTFTNNGSTYYNIPNSTEYDLYSVSATTAANSANLSITAATSGLTSNVNFVGTGTVTVTRTNATTITIAGAGTTESTSGTITSASAVVVDSFAVATYRTAEYTYHIKTTSGSPYYATGKILIVHDDSTTYMTQYGMLSTNVNDDLVTFTSNISGGNARLLAQATSADVVVKLVGVNYSTV